MSIESRDIIDRLQLWVDQKIGDVPPNSWGTMLAVDLREAIATIKGYRAVAGGSNPGESFRELAAEHRNKLRTWEGDPKSNG